ncbi:MULTISPECIES: hypothetical protein [unclassified Wolbachia]|uniref:hypothetical protein n=1 Tax=unclassified Wolbachia TaxID=2640676 RepID=UPI0030D05D45
MNTIQTKILKPKLGLLELAKQLGNVSQAIRVKLRKSGIRKKGNEKTILYIK